MASEASETPMSFQDETFAETREEQVDLVRTIRKGQPLNDEQKKALRDKMRIYQQRSKAEREKRRNDEKEAEITKRKVLAKELEIQRQRLVELELQEARNKSRIERLLAEDSVASTPADTPKPRRGRKPREQSRTPRHPDQDPPASTATPAPCRDDPVRDSHGRHPGIPPRFIGGINVLRMVMAVIEERRIQSLENRDIKQRYAPQRPAPQNMPSLHFIANFCGARRSGKTTAAVNMAKTYFTNNSFDKLYLISGSAHTEPKYKELPEPVMEMEVYSNLHSMEWWITSNLTSTSTSGTRTISGCGKRFNANTSTERKTKI
eukprot:jgi/Mesvir1/24355/Mv11030-RA.1